MCLYISRKIIALPGGSVNRGNVKLQGECEMKIRLRALDKLEFVELSSEPTSSALTGTFPSRGRQGVKAIPHDTAAHQAADFSPVI